MLPRPTWLHIPGYLALVEGSHHHDYLGHEDLFLYSSMYYCSLILISSASVRSIPFPFFIVTICAWNVHLVSLIFLKRSLVFPIWMFSSISFHWPLRNIFLSLLAILWNSAFKCVHLSLSPLPFTALHFSAICKASSDNHFAILHFFFMGWPWSLPPVQCHEPRPIVLQGFCLSDLIPWIYLSHPLYSHKGFDLGHTWMVCRFPPLSLLSSNLNLPIWSEFMIWATVSSQSCFRWLTRAAPSLASKNIINMISVLTT